MRDRLEGVNVTDAIVARLVGGRAHGLELRLPRLERELWVTTAQGYAEALSDDYGPVRKQQLNRGGFELYLPVAGLGPDHRFRRLFSCSRPLPSLDDDRSPDEHGRDEYWSDVLKILLEPLWEQAEPPPQVNTLRWIEIEDALRHINGPRRRN